MRVSIDHFLKSCGPPEYHLRSIKRFKKKKVEGSGFGGSQPGVGSREPALVAKLPSEMPERDANKTNLVQMKTN